jgi:lysyl-tRNA synthetase class 2
MASIDDIRNTRLEKLKAIERAGILAYPGVVKRTHTSNEAIEDFDKLSKDEKEVILVGRITSLRQHGALCFANIEDEFGSFQILFKKDGIGESGYQFFLDNFDIGDFIECRGVLFLTKKEEKTVDVRDYKMISKALLPLPEKWHGLVDVEERYRKRYLDLMFNKDVKKSFVLRSQFISEIRNYLEKEGFLEVETPVLQPIYGGATARPFKTHLNAFDMDLYLRISPELYLKRLLVGGFEKVYEIGRCFRNEGVDRSHNPDFTMLEFYQAYSDYKELMKFTEKFLSTTIKKVFGTLKIEYEGKIIDFTPPYPRIECSDMFKQYTGLDLDDSSAEFLRAEAKKMGIDAKGGKSEIADEIYKKCCRPKIEQPTFVIHYPAESFPLAKQLDDNPKKSASFQLIVMGMELVKAFSELNNPLEQRKRFEEQEKIFKAGFDEAQRMDEDFIEALEHAMPPAAGFGMGIDRITSILTNSHALREIILFPTMKNKEK